MLYLFYWVGVLGIYVSPLSPPLPPPPRSPLCSQTLFVQYDLEMLNSKSVKFQFKTNFCILFEKESVPYLLQIMHYLLGLKFNIIILKSPWLVFFVEVVTFLFLHCHKGLLVTTKCINKRVIIRGITRKTRMLSITVFSRNPEKNTFTKQDSWLESNFHTKYACQASLLYSFGAKINILPKLLCFPPYSLF